MTYFDGIAFKVFYLFTFSIKILTSKINSSIKLYLKPNPAMVGIKFIMFDSMTYAVKLKSEDIKKEGLVLS